MPEYEEADWRFGRVSPLQMFPFRCPMPVAGLVALSWALLGCREPPSEVRGAGIRLSLPAAVELPGPLRYTPVGISWLPESVESHRAAINVAAQQLDMNADVIAIVMLVESGGHARAESPTGARGLMQIIPSTGRAIAAERGVSKAYSNDTLFVADTNLKFGAYYLREQLIRFAHPQAGDAVKLAAAAYNGGPTKLDRVLAGDAKHSRETARYIQWVGGMWSERLKKSSKTLKLWRAAGGERLLVQALAAKPG